MTSRSARLRLLRCALLALLSASTLVACEPGNDLSRYSGRSLRVQMRDSTGSFVATLERNKPESGCLQLHPDVVATFDGVPLQVYPGPPIIDPDRCNPLDTPPTFFGPLNPELFFGEPRNGLLEIRDDGERIIGEFRNFFGRHTFAQIDPPPTVKPGGEIFLPWDPPTDDLSVISEVLMGETKVPARPEEGGVRFTVPEGFPTGRVDVQVRGSDIPPVRCEGVVECSATSLVILDRSAPIDVQP